MPKLFWKPRNEEVLQLSREESPNHQIFHLQEGNRNSVEGDGGKIRRHRKASPQDLLRIETHSSQLNNRSLKDSFGELRAHINTHPGREARERERDHSRQDFVGYQFPDDLAKGTVLRNGLPSTPNFLLNGSVYLPNGSLLTPSGRREDSREPLYQNGFDVDAEDDIAIMAAQRDQQRGSTRYIRGMMAPVISKDDDGRKLQARRPSRLTQRSESVLNMGEESSRSSSSLMEPRRSLHEGMLGESDVNIFREGGQGKGPKKRLPSENFLEDFGSRDIMAQSIMRQNLRGSRPNLFEQNSRNDDSSNRFKIGTKSTNEFTVFHPQTPAGYPLERRSSEGRLISLTGEIPSTHDDVQILNLQGFMDSGLRGQTALSTRGQHKQKSRRRAGRRFDDQSPVDGSRKGSRSRHKKKSKTRGATTGHNDEVILKDIDDIDEKMATLVVNPKQSFKDSVGRPITFEEAVKLRQILTGGPNATLPKEWMEQSFIQNKNPNLSYGIIQKKGGPCGVLASVQAHVLKSLIFGSYLSPSTSPASPLRPSTREWAWALTTGITEILWRISNAHKAILALPGSLSSHFDIGIGRYSPDGLTELLTLHEFTSEDSLLSAVEHHLQVFTNSSSSGCVLLLYSALLTRGVDTICEEMDNGGGSLINAHGYASQEVVNLLLTGEATTNTFNGDHTLAEEGLTPSKETRIRGSLPGENKMVLRGIHRRSEIGLLSLFEHYGSCKVGSHLKSPEYPVWVVCSESHYSVVFARDLQIARDDTPQEQFDVYYYDGLSLQDDEIRLTIDPRREPAKSELVPPLEYCLRTKWPRVHITWNGTEPIL